MTIPCSEPVVKGGLYYRRNYLSLFKPLKGQTAMSIETAVKIILIDIAVGRRNNNNNCNNNIIQRCRVSSVNTTIKKKSVLSITSGFVGGYSFLVGIHINSKKKEK